MNELKHTPGPWQINWLNNPTNPNYACIYVKPGDHKTVDHVCLVDSKNTTFSDWKENVKLIAAAPDMKEALIGACAIISTHVNMKEWKDKEDKVMYQKFWDKIEQTLNSL